ncbi:MAG: hypothetical protein FJ033_01500 [Chloroflexi bacterium]|nr:hypothetical protein [Chloroflexota bacterium]
MAVRESSGVLESIQRVVERSRYVHLDQGAIDSLAPSLARRFSVPIWDRSFHRLTGDEGDCNLILVLDALNFSFWGEPRWIVEAPNGRLNGYVALAYCLARAMDEGVPLTSACHLATMSQAEVARIFRGEAEIPMLARRTENLNEVGTVLLDRYEGAFARAIEAAGGSAVRLVRSVVSEFPSFDDVADYRGGEVRFYKRAQLLASDLHGAFGDEKWGAFDDLDRLTAFADYKLPQILRAWGILVYLPSLEQKIDHRFLLPPNCWEEIEIRAHTILAVERLRDALARYGVSARAFEIDWWLWHESQRLGSGDRPYHLTRTVNY